MLAFAGRSMSLSTVLHYLKRTPLWQFTVGYIMELLSVSYRNATLTGMRVNYLATQVQELSEHL